MEIFFVNRLELKKARGLAEIRDFGMFQIKEFETEMSILIEHKKFQIDPPQSAWAQVQAW